MIKLEAALQLAGHGLFVFPLKERGRTPAIKGWQERATTDAAAIRRLWSSAFSDTPRDFNIGVATGPSGLIVIDVDVKDGKQGDVTLSALALEHGLIPSTLRVRTPSGGMHYYLRATPIRNSVGRIGQGIDIRSAGGFVVGPGSETDKGTYTIVED